MPLRALSQTKTPRFEGGTYDLRHWEVRGGNDRHRIGEVDDVLVDDRGRTRYLSVHLRDQDKHVLLPCGQARVDRSDHVVWLQGLDGRHLTDLPEYPGDPTRVDHDYEQRIAQTYDRAYADDRYYDRPEYHTTWGRGREGTASGRLARLGELKDYKVAEHDVDPRGWTVIDSRGNELGKIDDMIADTGIMKVRYLTMKVDRNLLSEDREVLIPVGYAALERNHRRVRVDSLDAERVRALPAYSGGEITREHEDRLNRSFAEGLTGEHWHHHPRYRDEDLYPEMRGTATGTTTGATTGESSRSGTQGSIGNTSVGSTAAGFPTGRTPTVDRDTSTTAGRTGSPTTSPAGLSTETQVPSRAGETPSGTRVGSDAPGATGTGIAGSRERRLADAERRERTRFDEEIVVRPSRSWEHDETRRRDLGGRETGTAVPERERR